MNGEAMETNGRRSLPRADARDEAGHFDARTEIPSGRPHDWIRYEICWGGFDVARRKQG